MHATTIQRRRSPAASAQFSKPEPIAVVMARLFDRMADVELQHGHHGAAEFLARRAAEMREGA